MNLQEIREHILKEFDHIDPIELEIHDNEIVFEEDYEMDCDEKTDQDCYETAKENGEMIIEKFPQLEISDYYCHRSKYAIVCLKLKQDVWEKSKQALREYVKENKQEVSEQLKEMRKLSTNPFIK